MHKMLAIAAMLAAAPAAAVTISFTGSNANLGTTETYTASGQTLQAAGFTIPGSGANGSQITLTNVNLASSTAADLQRSGNGIGVCVPSTASCPQLESNNPRDELIRLTLGNARMAITSIDLGDIDGDDTFNLYGQVGSSLVRIGFGGPGSSGYVAGGLGGTSAAIPGAPANDYRLTINTGFFQNFFLLTNRQNSGGAAGSTNAGDGYSVKAVSFDVPEPGMLGLLGLGVIGLAAARRRAA